MACDCCSLACISKAFRTYFNVATLILLALCGIFTLTALVSPSWVVENSDSESYFGLFHLKYLPEYDSKNDTCDRAGSDLRDRIDSVAATLIIGIILFAIFTFAILWKLFFRTWFGKCGIITMSIFGFGCALFFIIGVSIFGATFNSWFFCGMTWCEYYHFPQCGLGYCFKTIIVCAVAVVAITSLIFAAEKYSARRDEIKLVIFLLCLVCGTAALIGICQAHWMQWVAKQDDKKTEWGIFFSCTGMGGNCTTNTYPPGTFNPRKGCVREYRALGSRYKAVAAFLIISILIIASMFIFFILKFYDCIQIPMTRPRKFIAVGCLGLSVLCQFLALVIFYHTMDTWYNCGEHFCFGKRSCNFGLSYIVGCFSVVLISIVFVCHLLDALEAFCYSPYATDDDPFALQKSETDEAMTSVNADT